LREDLREDKQGKLVAEGEEEAGGGFGVDEATGANLGVGPKGEGEGKGDQGDFVEACAGQVGDEGFLGGLVVGGGDGRHCMLMVVVLLMLLLILWCCVVLLGLSGVGTTGLYASLLLSYCSSTSRSKLLVMVCFEVLRVQAVCPIRQGTRRAKGERSARGEKTMMMMSVACA
jgi:hypothetical protein